MTNREKPPAPPTALPMRDRDRDSEFVVVPQEVRWDHEIGMWACRYTTSDLRILPEFREWQAIWINNMWEVDEV